MIREITLGDRLLQYDLERKQVKNINLRIRSDQSIYISSNPNVSVKTIEDFLLLKSDYILNALNRYAEISKYAPKPKQYIDGETFRVLGRDMRLRVVQGKKNAVENDEVFITLTIKDPTDFIQKKKTMDKWLSQTCKDTLLSVCSAVYPKFSKYGIDFPQIRFRDMISRWGSCQPKRKILTFNYNLIEAPLSCIEYVVVHEFTHFFQPNHSTNFYKQLSMFMPDWKERKKVLEKNSFYIE